MPAHGPQGPEFRGDLQAEVMAAVWRLGEATVEQVRELQPIERRSAYTTIQTVLNRLVDRGFLSRAKERTEVRLPGPRRPDRLPHAHDR